jgi:hypothetical protein
VNVQNLFLSTRCMSIIFCGRHVVLVPFVRHKRFVRATPEDILARGNLSATKIFSPESIYLPRRYSSQSQSICHEDIFARVNLSAMDRLTLARISSWQIDRLWRYFVSINYVLLWLHFGKENIIHIFSEVLTYHLFFCTFSFGHCVVCSSSIYGF